MIKDINHRLPSLAPLIESLHNYFFNMGIRDTLQEISKYIYCHDAEVLYENQTILEYRLKQSKLLAVGGKLQLATAQLKEALRQDPNNGTALQLLTEIESGKLPSLEDSEHKQEKLLSLAGIPPAAGFVGKFLLFRAAGMRGWSGWR